MSRSSGFSADMDTGLEYVSAIFFKRKLPTVPVVYKQLSYTAGVSVKAEAVAYKDYPKDTVFEVAATGFGAVMMTTDLLKRVWDNYCPPFDPMTQIGEDLSFCYRVNQLGVKMYCDSRVKAGHIGQYVFTESDYRRQL